MILLDDRAACDVDGCDRAAGHGHFGLYCEPCSQLPYGAGPA